MPGNGRRLFPRPRMKRLARRQTAKTHNIHSHVGRRGKEHTQEQGRGGKRTWIV
ncbi:hypothetical protein C8R42DRAFT_671263 [Lentinula raphanica]|nr:hypothetical protein C8R42DRAFT_671263 [Lentinula raphanica]